MIDDPERGRRLAAEGRAKVLAEFDAEASAVQLRAVFEEMLGDPAPSPDAADRAVQPAISNVGA